MSVEELVEKEPWRLGSGQPQGALDPTWTIERSLLCDGQAEYECTEGSSWWWCQKCGYCSKSSVNLHTPIQEPVQFLTESISAYLAKRQDQGVAPKLAMEQLSHVAGMAIRYATGFKTELLPRYLEQLKVR